MTAPTNSASLAEYDDLSIQRGPNGEAMVTLSSLTKVIGPRANRIHPVVFNYWPTGHRLLVVLDWVSETTESGIVTPEGVRQRIQEQVGAGLVIAVGGLVGKNQDRAPHPGGPSLKEPSELLYQHILFSMHANASVMTSLFLKPEYDQHIRMITDRDIWIVDLSSPNEWGSIG